MRGNSQSTIAIVRNAFQAWRKREAKSRDAIVDDFVKVFRSLGGEAVTGVRFERRGVDEYDSMRIQGERVYRWLDDETKDNNLLTANMLPYLLAALPMDLRIGAVADMLLPTGLSAHVAGKRHGMDVAHLLQAVAKGGGEATASLALLVTGAVPHDLHEAQRELTESIAAQQQALSEIEALINDAGV